MENKKLNLYLWIITTAYLFILQTDYQNIEVLLHVNIRCQSENLEKGKNRYSSS